MSDRIRSKRGARGVTVIGDPADGQVIAYVGATGNWAPATMTGGSGGGDSNVDGGAPDSDYGAVLAVDGGTP